MGQNGAASTLRPAQAVLNAGSTSMALKRKILDPHSRCAAPFVAWFKDSFFGEMARLDPQQGYVAPPLDGIWATAPYLHNGSIPTIAALLDSSIRPTYWTRSFESTRAAYDDKALGWKFVNLGHGKDGEKTASRKASIYDTTKLGYSNAGHTFGDALGADDRAAVIEYLKTL